MSSYRRDAGLIALPFYILWLPIKLCIFMVLGLVWLVTVIVGAIIELNRKRPPHGGLQ